MLLSCCRCRGTDQHATRWKCASLLRHILLRLCARFCLPLIPRLPPVLTFFRAPLHPRTSAGCNGRAHCTVQNQPANFVPAHGTDLQRALHHKFAGRMPNGRGGGILRQTSQAVPPLLSTWSCVWGTNVLLSAMPVMIHAISVALVHWSPTSSRRNTLEVPQQGARPEK